MRINGETIKLIIWDLDGTFWDGNLAEDARVELDSRAELIKELAYRGIISSLCSKNQLDGVKKVLREAALWEFFVFPKVAFLPKGALIRETIREMGLLAPNILFLDDEISNLREAERETPGIQTGSFAQHEPALRSFVDSSPRSDAQLTRLSSYREIEQREADRSSSYASNEEFLRESEITISINRDVESRLERVFELLNRTNQLNFTKRRVRSEEDQRLFRNQLNHFQSTCGLISCSDKFCDYGEIGFFQVMTSLHGRRLTHFAFSCRVLNMGVEAFMYRLLGKPEIQVAHPTAYPLETYESCDWIEETTATSPPLHGTVLGGKHSLFLGPCHLLQVSNYLGEPKSEFFHFEKDGYPVKYDCPGFLLSDPETVATSQHLDSAGVWTKEDFFRFREQLDRAECVVLDMADLLHVYQVVEVDGLMFRYDKRPVPDDGAFSSRHCPLQERVQWIRDIIASMVESTRDGCRILVLNRLVHSELPLGAHAHRLACDVCLREAVSKTPSTELLDLNQFVEHGIHPDGFHLSRKGYHELANSIIQDRIPSGELNYEWFPSLGRKAAADAANDPHVLRDVALQFEREGNLEVALPLMEKALSLNPHGDFLKEKVAEFRGKLGL